MTVRTWHSIAPVLVFAIAGCGSPSGGSRNEIVALGQGNEAIAATPIKTSGSRVTASDISKVPTTSGNLYGISLSRAAPAPNALYNAAYQRIEDNWEQVLYLCDGVGGGRVKLVTMPNAKGLSTLWTYRKPSFRSASEIVRIGSDDAGAGQTVRAIERSNGGPFGSIHSINPRILGDADVTTLPTLSTITDKNETTRCRWEARGRVLLINAKRSVLVIADKGNGYTYRSFDHATPGKVVDAGGGATNSPSTVIHGGRLIPADPGHEVYEFRKGPWTYRVSASADNTAPGAKLTVLRDGKPVQTSIAAAYQMAAKRIE